MAANNVFNIPIYGKPIELKDQGLYYARNRKTGGINNVFHLAYEKDEWYLYQLKNTSKEGEMGWVILADNGDYPLKSITSEQIKRCFDKPEYAEPKGAWQVMRNSRYGFGKFTSIHGEETRYAMILFSGAEILMPLLILKAEDDILESLAEPDR